LDEQKDALKLRDDLLRETKEWESGGKQAKDLVQRGERLNTAQELVLDPDFSDALAPAEEILTACVQDEKGNFFDTQLVIRFLGRQQAAVSTIMFLVWAHVAQVSAFVV
jgi:hypothetical protein